MKPQVRPQPTAGQVIRRSIAASVKRLFDNERGVLAGKDAEAVHQARVAVRRLRSDLKSFRRFFDKRWSGRLRQELAWLGTELGAMRDLDVQLERLASGAAQIPSDNDRALAAVLDTIREERAQAAVRTRAALRSPRYREIRDRLKAAARTPRFTQAARRPATDALRPVVAKRWKRVRKAVATLPAHPSTRQLHRVRILAKRLRYASETATPIDREHAQALAQAAAHLQDALGGLNDAETACSMLRRLRRKHGLALGANALLAIETDAARRARAAWYPCWRELDVKALRAWL